MATGILTRVDLTFTCLSCRLSRTGTLKLGSGCSTMKAYSSLVTALLVATATITSAGFIPGRRYCGYRLLDWGTSSPIPSLSTLWLQLIPHISYQTLTHQRLPLRATSSRAQMVEQMRWSGRCPRGAVPRVRDVVWEHDCLT